MMRPRPFREAAPGRFDARLKVPGWPAFHLMLAPKPYDVSATKQDEMASVAPTSYSPSSRNPFIEGTRTWGNWVDGAGIFVREKDGTHDYGVANGIDDSLGGRAMLAGASVTVSPTVTGGLVLSGIKQIAELKDGSYRRLYALTGGGQVWKCVGDPGTPADWVLSKDFSSALTTPSITSVTTVKLATPAAPTVTNGGASGPASYDYKIVAITGTNPPRSIPSSAGTNASGAATLTPTDYNHLSWSAVPNATQYEVWRTAVSGGGSPATLGKIATVAGTTYDDDGSVAGSPSGQPPATALGGPATYTYRIVGIGVNNPPSSVRSATVGTGTQGGAASLNATFFNTIAWTDDAGTTNYEIWRVTTAGATGNSATTGKIAVVAASGGANSYDDVGDAADAGSGTPTVAVTQTPTMMLSHFYAANNYLYVGTTAGTYWRFDGTTWTQGPDSGSGANAFTDSPMGSVFSHVGRYFYRAINAVASLNGNHVYRTIADPFVTGVGHAGTDWESWGGDSGEFPYTSMQILNEQLVSFQSGKIGIGSDGSDILDVSISPFAADPDVDNGRTSIVWGDPSGTLAIYARYGGTLLRIIPRSSEDAQVSSIGIERMVQNQSVITGYPTAAVGHNDWFLYFTIYNPTTDTSYLGKLGSWLNPEGHSSTRWEWTPNLHLALIEWAGVKVESLFISNISGTGTTGNPRLIAGCDDGTFRLVVLPANSPNPRADANCRFQTSGWQDLPSDDAGYGANLKSYHRATVLGETLNDGQTASVSYRLDGEDTLTEIEGEFTSPGQSKDFPEDVQGHSIAPRLTLTTDDATLTPEVHELQIHAQVRGPSDAYGNPGFVRQREITVRCEDGLIDRMGYPINMSPRQFRAALQAACAATDAELTLWDGVKRQVSVTSFEEGDTIGPEGYTLHVITLQYLEQTLATGSNASGRIDPGWGP